MEILRLISEPLDILVSSACPNLSRAECMMRFLALLDSFDENAQGVAIEYAMSLAYSRTDNGLISLKRHVERLKAEDSDEETSRQAPAAQVEAVTRPSDVQKVIRAERFELVDEEGKTRAELSREGKRAVFRMDGERAQSIQMVSDTGTGELAFRILKAGEYYPLSFGLNL
jgi:hypothetical protein